MTRNATSIDRATEYASAVHAGRIVAGPHVRAAAKRHLDDLRQGHERGLQWDLEEANLGIAFFEEVLCLNGGDFEGQPFILQPWQAFIVGSIYGWKNADGYRRFRIVYVETGKGSGKSPLAAGVGIRGLVKGRLRAEIYSAATKKDQAMILFRDAVAMVRSSEALSSRLALSGAPGREWNIAYLQRMSFMRPISSDEGQSGPRPHIGLIDELHEHKDSTTVEMMRAGFKNDPEPILFIITNSGVGDIGVCRDYHDLACRVAAGQIENLSESDPFFSYVCALDAEDDPFHDESCWVKANPSLPALPGMTYLREVVADARNMPSKRAIVERLNFCRWVAAASPWLSGSLWQAAARNYSLEDLRGRRCWGGLDLSSTTDTTACVLLFEPVQEGEPWKLWPMVWLPKQGLQDKEDKDRVPYMQWAREGRLFTTDGRAINPRDLGIHISQTLREYDIDLVKLAYDRMFIEQLKAALDNEGISLPLDPFGQGYLSMAPAVNQFERLLLNGQLVHPSHPILTSHAANVVLNQDAAGNRKPAKDKATGRIDVIVAAIMAAGVAEYGLDAEPYYPEGF